MRPPRPRIRRNTKKLDALKAGAVIFCMLLAGILIVWIAMQLGRQEQTQPDLTPRPGQSMWDTSRDR